MLFLISGNGPGAGKTTFAKTLGVEVLSLADGIRVELNKLYPGYLWWDRTQAAKMIVCQETGKTLREMLREHGQAKCVDNPTYWAERLVDTYMLVPYQKIAAAIDDVRKSVECSFFRRYFGKEVAHFHVYWEGAETESGFDNLKLHDAADYIIRRNADF